MADTLELKLRYWDYYPTREELTIESIEGLKGDIGMKIKINAQVDKISHFLYCFDGKSWNKSYDGTIDISFNNIHSPEPHYLTLKVKAVLNDGSETGTYSMTIGYFPSEPYAMRGRTSPSWIIILKTDLNLFRGNVEEWILDRPTSDEIDHAVKLWGNTVSKAQTDFEAAKALAKEIIRALEPCRGIPSDDMGKLRPFQQYKRAVSGKDKVWCGNIAAIYSYAANALGIPCRRIGMNYQLFSDNVKNYSVLLAEGHSTIEIFSVSLNRWIWMDPTLRILGAYIGDSDPLNLVQLCMFLNDYGFVRKIRLLEYNLKKDQEEMIPLTKSDKKDALLKYFKKDQIFRFYKK